MSACPLPAFSYSPWSSRENGMLTEALRQRANFWCTRWGFKNHKKERHLGYLCDKGWDTGRVITSSLAVQSLLVTHTLQHLAGEQVSWRKNSISTSFGLSPSSLHTLGIPSLGEIGSDWVSLSHSIGSALWGRFGQSPAEVSDLRHVPPAPWVTLV